MAGHPRQAVGLAPAPHRPSLNPTTATAGIDPAPTRSRVTWSQFGRSQAAVACDFAAIDIPARAVCFGGITGRPTGVWVSQAARYLLLRCGHRLADARAFVRDCGSQFVDTFDEIFRTERMKVLKTPVRTPVANAFAERWLGTLRRELLDRTVIWNQRQLNRLVVDYIDHYNTHRPHRSLNQLPPVATDAADQPDGNLQVVKTARCGELINEYRNAA